LMQQINTVKYGEKNSNISHEAVFEKTAIREASHTILSKKLMPHINIKQISVTPRNNTQGFVANNHDVLQLNMTAEDIKNRLCISLAGRIAQMKKYGTVVGMDMEASPDIQHATKDAYNAIAYYGMDKEVGYINIEGVMDAQKQTEESINVQHNHENIDAALERWMVEAEQRTIMLVNDNWELIEQLAHELLSKEIMYEEDLKNI